jgi:hypothetical protein
MVQENIDNLKTKVLIAREEAELRRELTILSLEKNFEKALEKNVLPNGNTVEIEVFRKKIPIRGGFTIMYDDKYEKLIEYMSTGVKTFKVVRAIQKRLESSPHKKINQTEFAKELGVSRKHVSKVILDLILNDFMMETRTKRYMWNPFVSMKPSKKSDGAMWQMEWNDIRDIGDFKKRGMDALDRYYLHKRTTGDTKITMKEYLSKYEEKHREEIKKEIITPTKSNVIRSTR